MPEAGRQKKRRDKLIGEKERQTDRKVLNVCYRKRERE